jgi:hypothetical protein
MESPDTPARFTPLIVTNAERPQPDHQLAPSHRISVAIAQDRTQRGQFTHVTQDWKPIPRPDVAAIGGDEDVALCFSQAEPRRLEGRNQIDFPVASADRVPIGQHDTLAVAEQISPPGVTVDHPGGKLKAELAVRGLELLAAGPQPAAFFLVDHSARVNGPAYRNKRLVGRQGNRGQAQLVQLAEQERQIGRIRRRSFLGQVPPEGDDAAVADDRLIELKRLNGGDGVLGEPLCDPHRGSQPCHQVRGCQQGDTCYSILRGKVVNGSGEQADQPRIR